MTGTAVFTGAGISGDAPASLPRGFGLRDDLLRLVHGAAAASLGEMVTGGQLEGMLASLLKLEVVLGRLSGAAGADAAGCLLSLRVMVPNEAHMLAALHLAAGGTHVTLNFDVGVELAYRLMTGDDAAAGLPADYRSALAAWRGLVPCPPPLLRVVAGHREFDAWLAEGGPPALLKIHGSLSQDEGTLVDVVVLDINELGQLTRPRQAAVGGLGAASRLLVTGYSGADPDVYAPLLAAAPAPVSSWCCYSLPHGSPVPADLAARGIALRTGAPGGLAVTALRELLGLGEQPAWPGRAIAAPGYRERFDRWSAGFLGRHPPDEIAVAWAWLLADGGDLDSAERMLAELASRPGAGAGTLMRLAEVWYTRARGDDRVRAEGIYRQIAADRRAGLGIRLLSRLRNGDIARGRAIRGGRVALRPLARAFCQPLVVLGTTRGGRREPEAAGDACRALQQTSLRVLERLAATAPDWSWPLLVHACLAARRFGGQAERLVGNGNRLALIRQHRLLLAAYAILLSGRVPSAGIRREAELLRDAYRSADDHPGAANLAVTLAVLSTAAGDPAAAQALLAEARQGYAAGRPDGTPIPSGQAQLRAVRWLGRHQPGRTRGGREGRAAGRVLGG